LAVAVATIWHRSHVPADLRASETRRGVVAWVAATETLPKRSTALFALIVELSRLTRPVRSSVFGTMPAEHLFSLERRLSGTDQGVESLEGSFAWAILRVLCRQNLRLPARLDHGQGGLEGARGARWGARKKAGCARVRWISSTF
jgi:hypothetical protein